MNKWESIAIVGVWLGLGISSRHITEDTNILFLAIFATASTLLICVFGMFKGNNNDKEEN